MFPNVCAFGKCALVLWPNKPALHLAAILHTTERAANLYIAGDRKISARCVAAIVNEMLS